MAVKLAHVAVKLDGKKDKLKAANTELYKLIQKPDLFHGEAKTYAPYATDGGKESTIPAENRPVQQSAEDVIKKFAANYNELACLIRTQDEGNTKARADVVMDGQIVEEKVPVTTLMNRIKMWEDFVTFLKTLPTPPTTVIWKKDDNQNLLVSEAPSVTQKTAKVAKVLTKAPPTDKHPAQVEVYYADLPIGEWTKILYSGAISATTKNKLVEYAQKIHDAYKEARETANIVVEVEVIKENNPIKQLLTLMENTA